MSAETTYPAGSGESRDQLLNPLAAIKEALHFNVAARARDLFDWIALKASNATALLKRKIAEIIDDYGQGKLSERTLRRWIRALEKAELIRVHPQHHEGRRRANIYEVLVGRVSAPRTGSSTPPSSTPPAGSSTPLAGSSTPPSSTPLAGSSTPPSSTPPAGSSTPPSSTPQAHELTPDRKVVVDVYEEIHALPKFYGHPGDTKIDQEHAERWPAALAALRHLAIVVTETGTKQLERPDISAAMRAAHRWMSMKGSTKMYPQGYLVYAAHPLHEWLKDLPGVCEDISRELRAKANERRTQQRVMMDGVDSEPEKPAPVASLVLAPPGLPPAVKNIHAPQWEPWDPNKGPPPRRPT